MVVLSSLTGKNREKLNEAGAKEYLEKNSQRNESLAEVARGCHLRINRKRGIGFRDTPTTI